MILTPLTIYNAWPGIRPHLRASKLAPYPSDSRLHPWVIFGGSYSGTRAAFARAKYPTTFLAAYASSAPVQARIDMSVYFEQIARGIIEFGFGNCTRDMHAAVQQIDKQLRLPATAAELKRKFLGNGSEGVENGGFGLALSLVLYNWQAWGMESCCGNGLWLWHRWK